MNVTKYNHLYSLDIKIVSRISGKVIAKYT